ncbi:HNH endonuclease [Elizabethkingia anophelis]|nr:HNH endonuclease [Elizabethkingia anophelis]
MINEKYVIINNKNNEKILTPYIITEDGIIKRNGRILKPYDTGRGYRTIDININGERFYKKIHRLVAEAFIPNPENKKEVNHKNGIKDDNRVENLEWVTPTENIRHSFQFGMNKNIGEKHRDSKLTEKQVLEIREKAKNKYNGYIIDLQKEYKVSQTSIFAIINRKHWKHI